MIEKPEDLISCRNKGMVAAGEALDQEYVHYKSVSVVGYLANHLGK